MKNKKLRKILIPIVAIVLIIATATTAFAAVENNKFYWANFKMIGSEDTSFSLKRLLQWSLYKQNYLTVLPDGYYGTQSKAAVRKFQRDNGIADDGIVGPVTWKKLQSKNYHSYTSITGYRYYKIRKTDETANRHFCAYNQCCYVWRVLYNNPSCGYENVVT